jgi:hypothetical protein
MDKKKFFILIFLLLALCLIIFFVTRPREGIDLLPSVIDQFWDRVDPGITRQDWEVVRVDRYNEEVVFVRIRLHIDRDIDVVVAYLPKKRILYLEDYSIHDDRFKGVMYVELHQETRKGGGDGG